MNEKQIITVSAEINAPLETVWKCWTSPGDIVNWNHASDDWHTTRAANDLRAGGRFVSRMEARDGSFGFDFSGTYSLVKLNEQIEYSLDDDRKVTITFASHGSATRVVEVFEAETENAIELQKNGWQMILNNFKKYTESKQ